MSGCQRRAYLFCPRRFGTRARRSGTRGMRLWGVVSVLWEVLSWVSEWVGRARVWDVDVRLGGLFEPSSLLCHAQLSPALLVLWARELCREEDMALCCVVVFCCVC